MPASGPTTVAAAVGPEAGAGDEQALAPAIRVTGRCCSFGGARGAVTLEPVVLRPLNPGLVKLRLLDPGLVKLGLVDLGLLIPGPVLLGRGESSGMADLVHSRV
ncbi:hypothetical protein [Plantactinospora sonchi]|uniref:Uncharacterized protein n=1 Tax=Plantactinospora sonchi TaxID=1544735 RepID=A0ABU7RPU7_9ACTN